MTFNILYMEDEKSQFDMVKKALSDTESIYIYNIDTPDNMADNIIDDTDLIIADVIYPDEEKREGTNRLSDILLKKKKWEKDKKLYKPIPVIAYTGRGRKVFQACLQHKEDLYDIWNKDTTSREYIAWRINRISLELKRINADRYLQRMVKSLDRGPSWRENVLKMVEQYDAGWTEKDQIERSGEIIIDILDRLGCDSEMAPLWELIKGWEFLSRAVSEKHRGHARHSINVFWLGYFIINSEETKEIFEKSWREMLYNRKEMTAVKTVPSLEAINNIWFFASIFHDVGYWCENAEKVMKYNREGAKQYVDIGFSFNGYKTDWEEDRAKTLITSIMAEYEEGMAKKIFGENPLENIQEIDHGIISSMLIREKAKELKNIYPIAREASRAIALHEIVCKKNINKIINWAGEELGCLLIICDQLQTWDRERGDENITSSDMPVRAELEKIQITKDDDENVKILIGINYISPEHLKVTAIVRDKVKIALKKVLRNHPKKAIEKIKFDGKLDISFEFYLDGELLGVKKKKNN